MMVDEPEYLEVDVLNTSWIELIAVAMLSCVNMISLVLLLIEHTAVLTGLPLSQNAQLLTPARLYCEGKYTCTLKFAVKAVIALKVNEYVDDCDFA